VVIAGDVGFRRGKTVPLQQIVDEALEGLDFVEHLVVYYRGAAGGSRRRAIDFNALLEFSPECPAEEMGAEE
jgi:acetyl-CoA synthetase